MVACGVSAIGNHDHRRTSALAASEHRHGRSDGVVYGRSTGGSFAIQSAGKPRRRRGPRHQNARQVIKRTDKGLVFTFEQVGHESIERATRIDDRLSAHAVTDVEEDPDADRRSLVRKLRNRLRIAVVEHLEGVPGAAGTRAVAAAWHTA